MEEELNLNSKQEQFWTEKDRRRGSDWLPAANLIPENE